MQVNITQNTKEWKDFRMGKIGASDAPIVLGLSPWSTAYQLWEEKLGFSRRLTTRQMQRGTDLEEKARRKFCEDTGLDVKPKVFVHKTHDFLIASLDGITDDFKDAVEIKCNGPKNHLLALEGKVPDYYNAQLQHQMFVCNLNYINYYSFDGTSGVRLIIGREQLFIEDMIKKEMWFYKCITEFIPPSMTGRDYIKKNDLEFQTACKQWKNVREQLKELEKIEESCRKSLIEKAGYENCEGYGVRVSKSIRKGSVDYKRIPQLMGVEIDNFRKEPTTCWKITENIGEYD